MLGFSRCERRAVVCLPILVLVLAGLVLICDSAWRMKGTPDFTCFTPQEFSDQQSAYTDAHCSSPNSGKYVLNVSQVPTRLRSRTDVSETISSSQNAARLMAGQLLMLVVLLCVPIAVADLLSSVADCLTPVSAQPTSTMKVIARCVLQLVSRLSVVVVYVAIAALIAIFLSSQLERSATTTNSGIVRGDISALVGRSDPGVVLCDLEIKKLGRNHLYTMQCSVRYGPQILVARLALLLSWLSTSALLVWQVVGTVKTAVLLIIPSSRLRALGRKEEEQPQSCATKE